MPITSNLDVIPEQSTAYLSGDLIDNNGSAVGSSTVEVLQISITAGGQIVNSRLHQDVLGTEASPINGGWLDSSGDFELRLKPADTVIVGDVDNGTEEAHEIAALFYWDSIASGTLTNPFATTSGSKLVTVSHAGHGLATGDDIVFNGGTAVGGLNCNGLRVITRIDANSYSFLIEELQAVAASTASGGGSVEWFANGISARDIASFFVRSIDKVPS